VPHLPFAAGMASELYVLCRHQRRWRFARRSSAARTVGFLLPFRLLPSVLSKRQWEVRHQVIEGCRRRNRAAVFCLGVFVKSRGLIGPTRSI